MLAETANDSQPWLQTTGGVLLALILIVACLCAWLTNLIAMPGNWICVLLIALYAWLGPADGRPAIGYGVVIAGFGCAFAGEVFEFLAGAWGAKRAGAGRKSTLYSILGSIAGAVSGAFIGIPIPVVGSLVAALVFGGVGAAAGAMFGEWSDGRRWRENWAVGHATFWGRTYGTLGKLFAGLVIVVVVIASTVI